jgi:hypothetical protein
MAAYMTISTRYPSWKEFYLARKKGTKGIRKETMEFEYSLASDDPFTYVNDPIAFSKLIDVFEDEYFLLLPAGGNRVNLVHSCFDTAAETEGEPDVFGILGSRRSSPFKRVSIRGAVSNQVSPRVTRSEERKETLAPSMQRFAKCNSADEFRDSVADPGERGYSADALEKRPCSCFVHRSVFEVFEKGGSMRAGDLAMKALKYFSAINTEDEAEEEDEEVDAKKRTQLLLFLWSVENNRMNKVGLSEPPDDDIFDSFAQKTLRKLDKEETSTEENPKEKERTANEKLQHKRSQSPRRSPSIASRSASPPVRPKNSNTDRIQSQTPPHDSPDGQPLAKFRERGRERGREKGRREKRRGKERRRKPSPSSSPSDSSSGSSRQSIKKSPSEPTLPRKSSSKSSEARSRSRSRSAKTKSVQSEDSDSLRRSDGSRGQSARQSVQSEDGILLPRQGSRGRQVPRAHSSVATQ